LPPRRTGNLPIVTRTGEKIFGVVAILVGLVLAFLAGVEANIHPLVLVLITVGVIAWVVYYFVVVRPSVTGLKRNRRTDRGTE
jgi:drug/metabolite transporter (DMT)-like permease